MHEHGHRKSRKRREIKVERAVLSFAPSFNLDVNRWDLYASGTTYFVPVTDYTYMGKASRAQRLPYDKELYKARSEIECTFNLLKQGPSARRQDVHDRVPCRPIGRTTVMLRQKSRTGTGTRTTQTQNMKTP